MSERERETYHQLVGDLGDDQAEGQEVKAGVVLKQLTRRLLEDDEGQREDESDVEAGAQHTGVLQTRHTANVYKTGSIKPSEGVRL